MYPEPFLHLAASYKKEQFERDSWGLQFLDTHMHIYIYTYTYHIDTHVDTHHT